MHESGAFRTDLLAGRAAFVTGGGSGICRGIALALAAHGCGVAVMGRTLARLESAAREVEAEGGRGVAVAGDVRDPASVESAIARATAALGRLDIVVNGAAGNFVCLADALSPNGFGAVVDIDLKGTFHVCRAAFPYLRARGGAILNISATVHHLGTIGQVHASAAKAGVDAVTRTLAVEWGPYGIRVNGIAPGPTADTEGARRLSEGSRMTRVVEQTPLGRLASIDDMARAALFLCSDAASFVNGVTLVVDGGLGLRSARMMADPAADTCR